MQTFFPLSARSRYFQKSHNNYGCDFVYTFTQFWKPQKLVISQTYIWKTCDPCLLTKTTGNPLKWGCPSSHVTQQRKLLKNALD